MVHSLSRIAASQIPFGTRLSSQNVQVLNFLIFDLNRERNKLCEKKKDVVHNVRNARSKYYELMPNPYDLITDPLFVNIKLDIWGAYDNLVIERNNVFVHTGSWTENMIYMDWVVCAIFASTVRQAELEEAIQILRGILYSWSKIKFELPNSVVTPSEVLFRNTIFGYYNLIVRSEDKLSNFIPTYPQLQKAGKEVITQTTARTNMHNSMVDLKDQLQHLHMVILVGADSDEEWDPQSMFPDNMD